MDRMGKKVSAWSEKDKVKAYWRDLVGRSSGRHKIILEILSSGSWNILLLRALATGTKTLAERPSPDAGGWGKSGSVLQSSILHSDCAFKDRAHSTANGNRWDAAWGAGKNRRLARKNGNARRMTGDHKDTDALLTAHYLSIPGWRLADHPALSSTWWAMYCCNPNTALK